MLDTRRTQKNGSLSTFLLKLRKITKLKKKNPTKIVGHVASVHFVLKHSIIIIIIVAVAAVVYNNNNNNFTICYPACLSTRRRLSQIRKEDHGPSIFTCPAHTIDVRQNSL